jgi:MFS family permease
VRTGEQLSASQLARKNGGYGSGFWWAYAANAALYAAHALLFRFAGFVAHLGGTEREAGLLVGGGLLAALAARVVIGEQLDRRGVRPVWLVCAAFFVAGSLLLLGTQARGLTLLGGRLLLSTGFAGMLACALTHAQLGVAERCRTERVGMLEKSVFVGLVVGSLGGDVLFATLSSDTTRYTALFALVAAIGVLSAGIALQATRQVFPTMATSAQRPRWEWRRPGAVVLAALMLGVNFAVTTVYLTRYFDHLALKATGLFFTAYCAFAFALRLLTRRWGETVGREVMVLVGLLSLALGQLAFCWVQQAWQVVLPALGCAMGRAVLYPAVVSLGAGPSAQGQTGRGTTHILGCIDVGLLLSAPVLGVLIERFGYPTMFVVAAALIFVTAGICFPLTRGRAADRAI